MFDEHEDEDGLQYEDEWGWTREDEDSHIHTLFQLFIFSTTTVIIAGCIVSIWRTLHGGA